MPEQNKYVKQVSSYLEKELVPDLKNSGHADLARKVSLEIVGKDLSNITKLSGAEKAIIWTNVNSYTKKAVETGKSNPVSPIAMAEFVSILSGVQEDLKQTKKYEIRSGAYFPSR